MLAYVTAIQEGDLTRIHVSSNVMRSLLSFAGFVMCGQLLFGITKLLDL